MDSFDILGAALTDGRVDYAVMAIENSIAGTILQNYRILRERGFWIVGERYLRIRHNLLACHGTTIADIKEVHSHPMAINQCLAYLRQYPHIKLVETDDTAKSAAWIQENNRTDLAGIASRRAADIYGMQVLAEDIETSHENYTRFFILAPAQCKTTNSAANKASIYMRIPDQKGRLLQVLQIINDHDLNMSKLQSFPVMGQLREYFFHLDIEFDHIDQYTSLRADLAASTTDYHELGIYERHIIDHQLKEES